MKNLLYALAGFVLWTVLWLGTNAATVAALPDAFAEDGSTTNAGVLALFLALSVVFSVVSGWLAVRLARGSSTQPASILGVLLLLVGIGVQASVWSLLPIWYHLIFLAMLFPAAVFGGRLVRPA